MTGLLPAAWLLLTGMAPVPAPLTLTEAESAQVMSGEIVVREAPGTPSPVIGIAYVKAAPEIVLEEVINLLARVEEVGPIQSLSLYRQDPGVVGAQWNVGMLGFGATFHVLYEYDRASSWCTFASDPSKDNDIETGAGSYQAYAHGDGSLMVYRTGGGAEEAPSWIKETLQSRGLREQMGGIRARAEAR